MGALYTGMHQSSIAEHMLFRQRVSWLIPGIFPYRDQAAGDGERFLSETPQSHCRSGQTTLGRTNEQSDLACDSFLRSYDILKERFIMKL